MRVDMKNDGRFYLSTYVRRHRYMCRRTFYGIEHRAASAKQEPGSGRGNEYDLRGDGKQKYSS